MSRITVIHPGLYTTVQDLGRKSYQAKGMPVSGSMDQYAHRTANLLLGNDQNDPVLELTIMGGTYEFHGDMFIALTGADMSPQINNQSIGLWRAVKVQKGDRLTFGTLKSGCRCYIAASGGINVPKVLGSTSTYVRGKLGGYDGRPLKANDVLCISAKKVSELDLDGRFIDAADIPSYSQNLELRVVLGPQDDAFTRQGIADFFCAEYTISNEFDRMGYRLEGKSVEHTESADIISDGIVKGAIQIPGHGQPIIMLSDCQTTGGYTKIAHVITSDLWKIAQAKAGDKIKFVSVGIEEAQEVFIDYENKLSHIESRMGQRRLKKDRDFKLSFMEKIFSVKVNEIEE